MGADGLGRTHELTPDASPKWPVVMQAFVWEGDGASFGSLQLDKISFENRANTRARKANSMTEQFQSPHIAIRTSAGVYLSVGTKRPKADSGRNWKSGRKILAASE